MYLAIKEYETVNMTLDIWNIVKHWNFYSFVFVFGTIVSLHAINFKIFTIIPYHPQAIPADADSLVHDHSPLTT